MPSPTCIYLASYEFEVLYGASTSYNQLNVHWLGQMMNLRKGNILKQIHLLYCSFHIKYISISLCCLSRAAFVRRGWKRLLAQLKRVSFCPFLCRWQPVKYIKHHSYCWHASSLGDKPCRVQTKKPCRVPPEMFLCSHGSSSPVPLARSQCLNAVNSV